MSIAMESDEYFPNLILDISIFWLLPYFRFYLLASLNYKYTTNTINPFCETVLPLTRQYRIVI